MADAERPGHAAARLLPTQARHLVGRRVLENGNRGLDHGWGNVMFVAGQASWRAPEG